MNTKFTIGIILLVIGIVLVGSLLVWNSQTNLPQEQGKTWVSRHLTQCAEEWQSWVYGRNKDKYKQPWEENKEANLILMEEGIREFYTDRHDIIIYDIQRENVRGAECEACHCSGDTKLFLHVTDKDVSRMLELGYTK